MAWPEQRWIGFLLIGIGLLIFMFGLRFEHGGVEPGSRRLGGLLHSDDPRRKRIALISLSALAIFALALASTDAVFFWPGYLSSCYTPAQIISMSRDVVPYFGVTPDGSQITVYTQAGFVSFRKYGKACWLRASP